MNVLINSHKLRLDELSIGRAIGACVNGGAWVSRLETQCGGRDRQQKSRQIPNAFTEGVHGFGWEEELS